MSLLGVVLTASACVVEDSTPPRGPTSVEFGEVINLGYSCGGPLTSWTVTNRDTGEAGTASCEQPVLFVDLAPETTYAFDIVGRRGNDVCWQGSCQVLTPSSGRIYPDCSQFVSHLCGI